MGHFGLSKFISHVVVPFLWNYTGDCVQYYDLYPILKTFCDELNKTLSNMRKGVRFSGLVFFLIPIF